MAAPIDWRRGLDQSEIFTLLRRNKGLLKSTTDSKCLMIVYDGILFIWDAYNVCMLTTNLKYSQAKSDGGFDSSKAQCQKLNCSSPPTFDIESICINETGTHVALIGKNGISVLELPERRGKYALFGDGERASLLCKTIPVAERFFVSSNERLLQASWHPGSPTDSHIVILSSDNSIRIYSLANPQAAQHTYPLLEGNGIYTQTASSQLSLRTALGDSAVAFDFGPPAPLNRRYGNTENGCQEYIWPVYVLWGNGEVFLLYTAIGLKRPFRSEVQGPLSMHPPAEDNYGTDACAVVCLASRPPVLVVSTCSGQLHHCVVLSQSEDEQQSSATDSGAADASIVYEPPSTPSLYVYESVELELSLTTVSLETDEPVVDDFSCPIRLHKDLCAPDRYHCSHSAGVHTVVLPWLHTFQHFVNAEPDAELPSLSQQQQAVVEHLVCTKPLPSSASQPVLGVCVSGDRVLGPTLLCLTASYDCITLPLHIGTVRPPPPPLLSEMQLRASKSPLKEIHKEPFDTHIRKILQKKANNPRIQTGESTDLTPQESFRLLSRATQVFREEYIQRLDQARDELTRRVRVLRDQKSQQQDELQQSKKTQAELTSTAGELAEKFEESKDRHQNILHRVETLLQKLQQRLPVLSQAERNMQRELTDMQNSVKTLQTNIKQLKIKEEYQRKQISRVQQPKGVSSPFNKTQTEKLHSLLKEETEDIADLIKQVNNLKVGIQL